MFKFYLDNNLVADPLNWGDFTETIERDEAIKGLLPKYETKLNFNAGGYKYLYDTFKSEGFCKLVRLRVDYSCDGAYETIMKGYIFISDCKFNLNKCIVECDVEDDNFGARIFNNKNIKAFLSSDKSKNGETITPATVNSITMFVPSTGNSVVGNRSVYKIKDAFRFLVDFMSDGLIGFESDYLGNDPILKEVSIAIGKEIRSPRPASPYISFEELFKEINKKFPIGFTIIRDSSDNPVIKIEEESFFYNTSNSLSIPNIEDLKQSFDNERLYSKVKFGGTTASFDAAIHHFGQIQFLSFKNEEYHLQGECNIDKELDLVGNFIADTNIIEELVATNTTNESYDEDTFFIALAGDTTAFPYPNPTTNTLPLYYNGSLTNNKVAERYSLANNLALYLGSGLSGFRASRTSPVYLGFFGRPGSASPPNLQVSPLTVVEFNNDSTPPNFDASGNYSTSLFRYTSAQDGNYQFLVRINGVIIGCVDMSQTASIVTCNSRITVYVYIAKYDASDNLIETDTHTLDLYAANDLFWTTGDLNKLYYLPTGYYCKVIFQWTHTVDAATKSYNSCAQMYILPNGTTGLNTKFLTTATTNGGGIYEYEEPGNYLVSKLEFERPLPYSDYKTLKLDLSKSLTVNHDGIQNKTAWLRKSVRKLATGETTWELISNINNV